MSQVGPAGGSVPARQVYMVDLDRSLRWNHRVYSSRALWRPWAPNYFTPGGGEPDPRRESDTGNFGPTPALEATAQILFLPNPPGSQWQTGSLAKASNLFCKSASMTLCMQT